MDFDPLTVLRLFRSGLDTAAIAKQSYGLLTEAVVHRRLVHAREQERRRLAQAVADPGVVWG